MNSGASSQLAKDDAQTELSVPALYTAITAAMVMSNEDLLSCHFGLWGPDTETDREALLRANRVLAGGCSLEPGSHWLDAGCGVGGTAIYLAETHGIKVTGLTNCEPHVAVAAKQAERRGVGHLVEFRHGNFMDLPFADASFDAVINHEAFCYASEKVAYLQGVRRVLKPGGRWQALEGLLSGRSLSPELEEVHARMQRGFRMPPLVTWRQVLADIEKADLEGGEARNLDAEVAPSTQSTRNSWLLYRIASPRPGKEQQPWIEFMQAALDFDEGLRHGAFTYRLLSGRKPP